MTKIELNKILKLDNNTQILLSVWADLEIDGSWEETFEAITDVRTLKEIVHQLKDNKEYFGVGRCNNYTNLDYKEFINNAEVEFITQTEIDVLKKFNACNSLDINAFLECVEETDYFDQAE